MFLRGPRDRFLGTKTGRIICDGRPEVRSRTAGRIEAGGQGPAVRDEGASSRHLGRAIGHRGWKGHPGGGSDGEGGSPASRTRGRAGSGPASGTAGRSAAEYG